MAKFEIEHSFNAPMEKVFDVCTNIPETADIVDAITKVEMLSDGDVGVGTRWRETRMMFGREATEEMEITEFERPNRFVVEAESCGVHFRTEFIFTGASDTTNVKMKMTSKANTFFAKLMSPLGFLMKGTMIKCLKQDLVDCQKACESPQEVLQ